LGRAPVGKCLEINLQRIALILALLAFWLFLAYRRFAHGDLTMAGVFLAVGIALTVHRLKSRTK
jgi:ABC-type uncharacterized transport system permease subunit